MMGEHADPLALDEVDAVVQQGDVGCGITKFPVFGVMNSNVRPLEALRVSVVGSAQLLSGCMRVSMRVPSFKPSRWPANAENTTAQYNVAHWHARCV